MRIDQYEDTNVLLFKLFFVTSRTNSCDVLCFNQRKVNSTPQNATACRKQRVSYYCTDLCS